MRAFVLAAVALLLLVAAAPADAEDRGILDSAPASPGHVVVDPAGNAYVAWTHHSGSGAPDPVKFCKVPAGGTCAAPIDLAIPGAVDHTGDAAGAFPVLGSGGTVYVVAPRYVADDVVIWKSTDGGATFGPATVAPKETGYSNKSEPTDAILDEEEFVIGAFNPGVGISGQPVNGNPGHNLQFAKATGTIGTASTAFALPKTLVVAYWTLNAPYQMFLLRYDETGSASSESNWEGPVSVGGGYETKLAAGPSGVFLVSQDYAGGENPTAVRVRKLSGIVAGPAVTLAADTSTDLFAGGAISESPSGHLAVAWPGIRGADQAKVMRLFSSSDGGTSFTESDIAHIGDAYTINENAQLAVADSGAGWLTFLDAAGLHLADTAPVAGPVQPPTYKGKEKTVGKPVGPFELTLRLPKSCLQPGQPFFAGAGKRVRHRVAKALRSKLTLKTATFFFDGKKLRKLKKKPLKLLIEPGFLPAGSVHQVKVKITAVARKGHGKRKKVVRTLKGTVAIC
jgi:hypothetical protein